MGYTTRKRKVLTMAEYIKIKDLIKLVTKNAPFIYHTLLPVLLITPTVDAVEVVRCKNCVHFIPDEFLDHTEYPNDLEADGLCDNIDKYTDGDRYCSSGAKMDGKDDNR